MRVQLRRHGVGDHTFQDVVLRGHHVLDEEIGGVIDVEVVLKAKDFNQEQDTPTREPARHLSLGLVTFHPQNVESRCHKRRRAWAPVTLGCQQRVCERF